MAAVADADVGVRSSVFKALYRNPSFDDFLAQADIMTSIFVALNDEEYHVRELAISVAGRLSEKNPAYVLPALRRYLIQLLTYLDQRFAATKFLPHIIMLLWHLLKIFTIHTVWIASVERKVLDCWVA
jgi:phosphatidylinositol kinase/protein kinase (PI-3  family)